MFVIKYKKEHSQKKKTERMAKNIDPSDMAHYNLASYKKGY